MVMWTRKQVKERGKKSFKKNYWKAFIVAILMSIIIGSGASGGVPGNPNSVYQEMQEVKDAEGNSVDDTTSDEISEEDSVYSVGPNTVDVEVGPGEEMMVVGIFATAFIVFTIILAFVILVDALVANPLEMGCNRFFLKNLDENADISVVTYAFDHNYKNVVGIMLRRDIAIVLWGMLFIIPGIVKSYEYRMIPYLLSDNPEMTWKEAFARSKEMMTGNKWKSFVLDLSFIGWNILSIFTFGLLSLFYVNPYKYSTNAALYEAIKVGA